MKKIAWDDFNYVLNKVKQDGFYLDHASNRLKDTEEIVLAAIEKDSCALRFASEKKIISNKLIILKYIYLKK